jgi:hypothetical protein
MPGRFRRGEFPAKGAEVTVNSRNSRHGHSADEFCKDCGYEPELKRSLNSFQVFAVSFASISVAVGIFGTYDDVLEQGGPVAIWLWPVAAVGQLLVALVYAQFAARIPLSGSSYQWASRLANPKIGWVFGWLAVFDVPQQYRIRAICRRPIPGEHSEPTKIGQQRSQGLRRTMAPISALKAGRHVSAHRRRRQIRDLHVLFDHPTAQVRNQNQLMYRRLLAIALTGQLSGEPSGKPLQWTNHDRT